MMDTSSPAPTEPTPPSKFTTRLSLWFALVLVAVLGLAAWAGYQSGATQRESNAQATRTADLQTQFQMGLEDLQAKRYTLAITRFEYILSQSPNYPEAAARLAEARAALSITAPPPTPTPPVVTGKDPAEMLALAQQYAAEQNWEGVLAEMALLRSTDASYEVATVDGLLYTALRGRGIARILGDEMEAGITDIDHASQYRALDEIAASHRAWARLYLAARLYYGLDWARATGILRDLYLLAPNFKDTTQLLYDATVSYAAQLTLTDVCAAAEQYAFALTIYNSDPAINEALTLAQTNCALTPTPDPNAPTPDPNAPTPDPNATSVLIETPTNAP